MRRAAPAGSRRRSTTSAALGRARDRGVGDAAHRRRRWRVDRGDVGAVHLPQPRRRRRQERARRCGDSPRRRAASSRVAPDARRRGSSVSYGARADAAARACVTKPRTHAGDRPVAARASRPAARVGHRASARRRVSRRHRGARGGAACRPARRSRPAAARRRAASRAAWTDARARGASRAAPGASNASTPPRERRVPYAGSPTSGWPIAARCTRIWCVRPVSSRQRTSVAMPKRSTGVDVRARAACRSRRPPSSCACAGCRPIGASTVVAPLDVAVRDGEVLALDGVRARARAPASVCAASVFATTSRPLVSLSSRCTMPARGSARERRRVVQQRVEQRAVAIAAARVHDEARRLVDDEQRVVLVDDRERDRPAAHRRAASAGTAVRDDAALAAAQLAARLGAARRRRVTSPASIHALRRLRECSGQQLARAPGRAGRPRVGGRAWRAIASPAPRPRRRRVGQGRSAIIACDSTKDAT